jgi:hypothetical protein
MNAYIDIGRRFYRRLPWIVVSGVKPNQGDYLWVSYTEQVRPDGSKESTGEWQRPSRQVSKSGRASKLEEPKAGSSKLERVAEDWMVPR